MKNTDYTKIEEIKAKLKSSLDRERYEHSLGTAEVAYDLAEKYGLDKEKAYFCGLIHDCAKCMPKEELKKYLENYPAICDGELINPKTYHAPVGAIIAKQMFGVNDEEVLSAIRWHTLGNTNMTDFEKIIYIADKIEYKTRPQEYAEPIRNALKEENGLDKALFVSYKNTLKSLADRELRICKMTVDVYNKLLEEL
ncbi:MAG: bis(5'-nucleosyl)-tetraphosphatase (symmetrical) YqeK [bacterium]|nr:bis(5'-nucleosyl)-tetraphosphatase (symmetrical) YqeK [bacterium]